MGLAVTREELWNVVYRAYQAGHFGPPAFPNDPLPVQMLADKSNLLHLAAGGPDGITELSERNKARLVASLEDLFNGELFFEIYGMLSFRTLEGVRWRPREAGGF